MSSRFWRNRAAKATVGYIVMVVVVIFIAASALPGAINAWIGNGTMIHTGTDESGTVSATLNPLWVTVGGIILVAVILMAFLRSRG